MKWDREGLYVGMYEEGDKLNGGNSPGQKGRKSELYILEISATGYLPPAVTDAAQRLDDNKKKIVYIVAWPRVRRIFALDLELNLLKCDGYRQP